MKKITLIAVIIFLTSNLFAHEGFSKENNPITLTLSDTPGELIVSFEKLSSKQYQDLDLALSEINGIRKIGFCERMNVFYFSYDTAIYRSAEEAFEALIVPTKKYQPLLKIGASAADVEKECNK